MTAIIGKVIKATTGWSYKEARRSGDDGLSDGIEDHCDSFNYTDLTTSGKAPSVRSGHASVTGKMPPST